MSAFIQSYIIFPLIILINLLFALAVIFLERKKPSSTWAWLLVLFFLPFVGFLLYLLLGRQLRRKHLFRWEGRKDIGIEKLIATLRAAYEASPKARRDGNLSPLSGSEGVSMFWGVSPLMTEIRRNVEKIAPTDATVLITGENGTGKDVLAREIHAASARRHRAMV